MWDVSLTGPFVRERERKNRPALVPVCCEHFPDLLIRNRMAKRTETIIHKQKEAIDLGVTLLLRYI